MNEQTRQYIQKMEDAATKATAEYEFFKDWFYDLNYSQFSTLSDYVFAECEHLEIDYKVLVRILEDAFLNGKLIG